MGDRNRTPPPTRPGDDGYEHRRASDPGVSVSTHRRWYDSTKAQLVIAAMIIGLMAGSFGTGAAVITWFADVTAAPVAMRAFADSTRTWRVDHIREHDRLGRRLDVLTEVTYCTMRSRSPDEADRCLSESTRNQLEAMTRSRR